MEEEDPERARAKLVAEIMSGVSPGWSERPLFGVKPWIGDHPREVEEQHPHGDAGRTVMCRACMLTHPAVVEALVNARKTGEVSGG